ncbi:MAG: hypothetical protein Q6J68_05405 [Thermostichales cyanobacterium SZTDM-1c_bins_54]
MRLIEVAQVDINSLAPGGFRITNFDLGSRYLVDSMGRGVCTSSDGYVRGRIAPFTASREPDGIAISPDGRFFITADEDNVAVVDYDAGEGDRGRSISAFDAVTGALLGDSGNLIEQSVVRERLPMRCSSKGPEPEVVDLGVVEGRLLAFVSLERSDAVSIFDVTRPGSMTLLDTVPLITDPTDPNYVIGNDRSARLQPEGIKFIPATHQVVVSNSAANPRTISLINLTVTPQ